MEQLDNHVKLNLVNHSLGVVIKKLNSKDEGFANIIIRTYSGFYELVKTSNGVVNSAVGPGMMILCISPLFSKIISTSTEKAHAKGSLTSPWSTYVVCRFKDIICNVGLVRYTVTENYYKVISHHIFKELLHSKMGKATCIFSLRGFSKLLAIVHIIPYLPGPPVRKPNIDYEQTVLFDILCILDEVCVKNLHLLLPQLVYCRPTVIVNLSARKRKLRSIISVNTFLIKQEKIGKKPIARTLHEEKVVIEALDVIIS
ncbi:uncharacterized protein EV154DRAFT_488815 [Mucor mucedo]|uniref:uncharacterized protein n=1 Tax=Mucor mucedo TaxID=29922 RepID=UPI0022200068|nr:uncharacterized protein EV154DRAFT_488815 [Mucor mucedo]KAI7864946.1 hypothetical protein EV154DRAFT_488815 [Mucor mucedo]